jgi:hypothetical protein
MVKICDCFPELKRTTEARYRAHPTAGCPGLNTLRDPVPVATELEVVRTHEAAA